MHYPTLEDTYILSINIKNVTEFVTRYARRSSSCPLNVLQVAGYDSRVCGSIKGGHCEIKGFFLFLNHSHLKTQITGLYPIVIYLELLTVWIEMNSRPPRCCFNGMEKIDLIFNETKERNLALFEAT